MATLSVLKFDDPGGAYRVLIALQGLQEREVITLEDATVVSWPEGNNKPKASQLHGTSDVGAISGAFWGFLIGGPLAALFASWPIALGQALRALADVAEYVRDQQQGVPAQRLGEGEQVPRD